MKIVYILYILIFSTTVYSQEEGQHFCEAYAEDSYFPLTIETKKLLWGNTYYFEKIVGVKKINNKEYVEFSQDWENGATELLYLREKDGIIYQYENCCDTETIRTNKNFKKGHTWKTADLKTVYTIETLKGSLKTPYCNYENLLVIKAQFDNFALKFYYKKGYGYIGATENKKLISYATPDWK